MTSSTRTLPLAAIAILLATILAAVRVPGAEPAPVVAIAAHRFEFSPGQLELERGKPVVLRLTSLDVAHGFYSKQLGLDEIIEPGKVLEVPFTPGEAGRFTIICDHFCGSGHGNMKMTVLVR